MCAQAHYNNIQEVETKKKLLNTFINIYLTKERNRKINALRKF